MLNYSYGFHWALVIWFRAWTVWEPGVNMANQAFHGGDWDHFLKYAGEVMSFLPASLVIIFAVMATICEISFGVLLLIGKWTRLAALGSGILAFIFACSMAISSGIVSPLSYSVFTVSAASFLLATLPTYKWSLDNAFYSK